MNQIEQVQQDLHAVDGVPALLSASWEAFELVQAGAAGCADQAVDMYPVFTSARDSAVSGRNAIVFAPSMPAGYAEPLAVTLPITGDVYEVADAIAGLASALSARLREPPGLRTMQDCEVVLGGNDFGFGGLDRASFPSSFP